MMRGLARDILTSFFILLTTPCWVAVRLTRGRHRDSLMFVTFGQLMSLIPGTVGVFARRAYYVMTLESCAKDVGIAFGTWFSKRNVEIARRVSLGAHCLIGACRIGEGALIGSNVDILSGRHQHSVDGNQADRASDSVMFTQVKIGENAWIGNRAVVMADVGNGAVIGAGSVVVHSISDHSLAVGNPAVAKRTLQSKTDCVATVYSTVQLASDDP